MVKVARRARNLPCIVTVSCVARSTRYTDTTLVAERNNDLSIMYPLEHRILYADL